VSFNSKQQATTKSGKGLLLCLAALSRLHKKSVFNENSSNIQIETDNQAIGWAPQLSWWKQLRRICYANLPPTFAFTSVTHSFHKRRLKECKWISFSSHLHNFHHLSRSVVKNELLCKLWLWKKGDYRITRFDYLSHSPTTMFVVGWKVFAATAPPQHSWWWQEIKITKKELLARKLCQKCEA